MLVSLTLSFKSFCPIQCMDNNFMRWWCVSSLLATSNCFLSNTLVPVIICIYDYDYEADIMDSKFLRANLQTLRTDKEMSRILHLQQSWVVQFFDRVECKDLICKYVFNMSVCFLFCLSNLLIIFLLEYLLETNNPSEKHR